MPLATLVISGRDWVVPVAILTGFGFLLLVWGWWRTPERGGWRVLSVALKSLAFLALGACLIEPIWVGQRAKPGSNYFLIVADNSEGMQIHDAGDKLSRGAVMRELLTSGSSSWGAGLDRNFQVRRYFFDSRVQPVRDFSDLRFDGRSSAIGSALQNLAERYRGQPLAGVLLLTDGNATDLPEGRFEGTGLPPVYPVLIGRDRPPRDIAIEQVSANQSAFEDAPVTVQASVRASGYAGKTIVAQLFDDGGTKVAEQSQTAPRGDEKMTFRFQLRPARTGVLFYSLQVSARDELRQLAQPEHSEEATLINNRRAIVVDRKRGPYRLLYVGGRPNWEFKFLNRAVEEDSEMQMSGLFRIARREPKFEFRTRQGESSNPLFRGFDRKTEETERYDQPVLKPVNVRDKDELIGGFPKTAEDLFVYHALILDDVEAEFFTADQLALIQKFVSERGGGFLMLGGQETFREGRYERTPVGDMLPVYLTRPEGGDIPKDFQIDLAREGWLQPWARLRDNESDEKSRLSKLPPFQVLNRVGNIKPAATIVALVRDSKGRPYPALVGQQFGVGRSAALMIGDFWRSGLQNETAQKDLGKAWRQLIRWLVADVPERVSLEAKVKANDPQSAVSLRASVRDRKFQRLDLATVQVHVVGPGESGKMLPVPAVRSVAGATNALKILAEPLGVEAGVYAAEFVPRQNGGYLAEAVATDERGVEVGRSQTGWVADPASEEFRSLTPNRALLERIAERTGGEIVDAGGLSKFVANLPLRKAPVTETWSDPLWHRSTVFLFALLTMAAEWGLRRWRGLA